MSCFRCSSSSSSSTTSRCTPITACSPSPAAFQHKQCDGSLVAEGLRAACCGVILTKDDASAKQHASQKDGRLLYSTQRYRQREYARQQTDPRSQVLIACTLRAMCTRSISTASPHTGVEGLGYTGDVLMAETAQQLSIREQSKQTNYCRCVYQAAVASTARSNYCSCSCMQHAAHSPPAANTRPTGRQQTAHQQHTRHQPRRSAQIACSTAGSESPQCCASRPRASTTVVPFGCSCCYRHTAP